MRKLDIERLIKSLEQPHTSGTSQETTEACDAQKSDAYVEGNTSDSTDSDGDDDASGSSSDEEE